MKRNQVLVLAAALCSAAAAEAGGWRLSIGPAYRARMKTEMRGAPAVADTTEITKTDRYRDMENGNWGAYAGDSVARPDPEAGNYGIPSDAQLWGISAAYSETTVAYDGSGSAIDATDRPSLLGLKAKLGYDFYESETKCGLGFAGEVGLAAYVTENVGLYAEVGYEWVDGFDAAADGIAADVDFSSLVVSAGLTYRF